MTMTSTNLTAALVLARTGLPVFPIYEITNGVCACGDPCGSPGKHPRIREGLYGATTDQGIIRGWWQKWPDANLAIATGAGGLVVIDIDPDHGGDESWRDLLAEMGSSIGETVTAITGSGGTHLLYRAPEDVELRNTAGRLGPGIDTRGAGGYIVVAPSNHVSGNRYAWEEGYAPWDRRPSPLPAALMERLTRPAARGDGSAGDRPDIATLWQVPCPQGQRDNTLITLVGWARTHIPSRDVALAMLVDWDTNHCQPPLGEAVVREKVYRAWERWTGPARIEWKRLEEGAAEAPADELVENTSEGPAEHKSRWNLIDAVDYLDQPPPPWLIEGIATVGAFGCIYGPSGAGKTFFALHMAFCCAAELPFFGRQIAAEQGAIVYVAAEGAGGLSKRIRAWQQHFGVDIPRGRMYFLPAQVPFVDDGAVRALVADIRALGVPVSHVFIDTVSRALAGGDENSPETMGSFVLACGRVQEALGANVTAIHHGTKADGTLRGHSSLPGALDWIVRVTSVGEGSTRVVRAAGEKQKDAEPLELLELRPVQVDITAHYQTGAVDVNETVDGSLIMRPPITSVVLEPLSETESAQQARARARAKAEKRAEKFTELQVIMARALYTSAGLYWTTHAAWWAAGRNLGLTTPQREGFRKARASLIARGLVETRLDGDEEQFRCTEELAEIVRSWGREGNEPHHTSTSQPVN